MASIQTNDDVSSPSILASELVVGANDNKNNSNDDEIIDNLYLLEELSS
jgi:hypothetical protein